MDKSQDGGNNKSQIFQHLLPPDTHTYTCVSVGKKCSFFVKFGVVCFLVTSVLRLALLPYYQRIEMRLSYTEEPWQTRACGSLPN